MASNERWLEIKRIANDALEVPAESRAAFLERICPDALRADVEQLLRSCDRLSATPTFLDAPAVEFAIPIIANVEEHPINLVALQAALAGRYTIERELGRGGMAIVYLAHDERHRRRVALKVVHSNSAILAGSSAARFQREIEIAARLTHPHIVALHDSGTAAECLYYVMPFVSGESLREHLARRGPLPFQDALRVMRDVARALAYAHREGIAHRDIKPGNILLNQDGDALIADFGIASALAAARVEGAPEYGDVGLAFGTPAYSAPEQLRGVPDTDHRADLYSFGVMAYELLCGARPFAGRPTREPLAVQQREVAESLTSRRPDLPPALAALIEHLISHDPDGRPRDAGEVLRALDTLTTSTGPNTNPAPRRRKARRAVVLASALSLALVVTAAFFLPRPHGPELGTSNEEARRAYERGSSLAEDSRPANLREAILYFEKAIEIDPRFARAWAGLANAYTYQALFSIDVPDDVRDKARQAAKQALELDPNLVEANVVHAHQLFVFDCRVDESERAFKRTLDLDSTNAQAQRLYGLFLHFTGRDDSALAHLHRARSLSPATAGAEDLIGRVFVDINKPDSAIPYLESALKFRRDIHLAYEPLAFALLEKKLNDSAIATMRRAAALNPSDSAQLAYIYAKTGHDSEARLIVRNLLKTQSQRRLPNAGMAMAYGALGDVDEAFRWMERGLCAPGLAVDAGFESLRSDPRFPDLLRRKGLSR